MANLTESSSYDSGVRRLDTTEKITGYNGSVSGLINAPIQNLTNRTKYLKDAVDILQKSQFKTVEYAYISNWNTLTTPGFHQASNSAVNAPTNSGGSLAIVVDGASGGTLQLSSILTTDDGNLRWRNKSEGTWGTWHIVSSKAYVDSTVWDLKTTLTASVTPSAEVIGAEASVGYSPASAKADHIHAMPALATTTVSGFLSNVDKIKLTKMEITPSNSLKITMDDGSPSFYLNSNGQLCIGKYSTNGKLFIHANAVSTDAADSASIILSNRNTGINGGIAGGVFIDTYRDISDPHISGGMWFTRNPQANNASSSSDLVVGLTSGNMGTTLPTQIFRLTADGNLVLGNITELDTSLPTYQSTYGLFSGSSAVNIAASAVYNNAWVSTKSDARPVLYAMGDGIFRWEVGSQVASGANPNLKVVMTLDADGKLENLAKVSTSVLYANLPTFKPDQSRNDPCLVASGAVQFDGPLVSNSTISSKTITITGNADVSNDISSKNINNSTKITTESIKVTGTSEVPDQVAGSKNSTIANTKYVDTGLELKANLNSPELTGVPKSTNPDKGDNSTRIATTNFVTSAVNSIDLTPYAKLASPSFVGTPSAPTPSTSESSTTIATTNFVYNAIASKLSSSPALGNTPTATTADVSDNSTRIATTAFVKANVPSLTAYATSSWVSGNYAPINSPGFTGSPTAPTPAATDGDGRIATVGYVKSAAQGIGVPVGTVIYFAATSAPNGFLICDGTAYYQSQYPQLHDKLYSLYPGGSTDTFRVPDLRGEFIRGWDAGKGVDSGRALGSAQANEVSRHSHFVVNSDNTTSSLDVGDTIAGSATGGSWTYERYLLAGTTSTATRGLTSSYGGSETRPRNIALLPCIKAYDAYNAPGLAEINVGDIATQTWVNNQNYANTSWVTANFEPKNTAGDVAVFKKMWEGQVGGPSGSEYGVTHYWTLKFDTDPGHDAKEIISADTFIIKTRLYDYYNINPYGTWQITKTIYVTTNPTKTQLRVAFSNGLSIHLVQVEIYSLSATSVTGLTFDPNASTSFYIPSYTPGSDPGGA